MAFLDCLPLLSYHGAKVLTKLFYLGEDPVGSTGSFLPDSQPRSNSREILMILPLITIDATPAQALYILDDPTFAAFWGFYTTLGEQLGESLYIGSAMWVHQIAHAHQDAIPYTTAVEAVWSGLCHLMVPPAVSDWRMWSVLDQLEVTPDELAAVESRAQEAVYGFGKHYLCMSTQAKMPHRLARRERRCYYMTTPLAVKQRYTTEEHIGSMSPRFGESVVGAWQHEADRERCNIMRMVSHCRGRLRPAV